MSTSNSATHQHDHAHEQHIQPIETSAYTYDTHRPSALATRNLISQEPSQHSPTSPSGPTPSRIHPIEHPGPAHHHRHHERHHTQRPEHEHEHDKHSPSSPTSTIGSDSIQEGSVGYGSSEGGRRQSWSRQDLKRDVMEGLLEKGKGKQAKGGYSSTNHSCLSERVRVAIARAPSPRGLPALGVDGRYFSRSI